MKVLIIEDEKAVSDILIRFLNKIDKEIEVLDVLISIEKAINWLNSNSEPDLIFMDVKLPDGNSFEIFDNVLIESPIIFTTGYDEFALQAFKVNSIDYLMKPLNPVELKNSIEKYKKITQKNKIAEIDQFIEKFNKPNFKTRFLVKTSKNYQSISTCDVAFICVENKLTFLYTSSNQRFIMDNTLDEINKSLSPDTFFRINRQFIINFNSIESIENYFNNRLNLKLTVQARETEKVLVSAKKVSEFKTWLNR